MCSLCGMLGDGRHWTDRASSPEAFRGSAEVTRRRERQQRTRLVNRILQHYGLTLSDWAGNYVLRSHTGQTVLVDNLAALWPQAEALGKRPCDPLDESLLTALREP